MAGESLLPPVVAVLLADIKEFTAKMETAKGEMDAVGSKGAGLGSQMAAGLAVAGGAVGALALGVGVISTKMAMDFGSAMTSVQNSAGLSEAATNKLQDAFLNTAFKTEFSGTQIAQAYATVAGQLELLNGKQLSTSQAMDFVNKASDLATAKQISLSDAMGATTQTMKAFQVPVAQAGEVTNDLYVTSGLTGSSIDALAGQFTKMHLKLGDSIPSLGDMNTLMVDMTSHGVGQGRALMTVTGAMTKLLDPSTKNVQVLQDMGIHAYDATGKFVGMGDIIGQLAPKFAGLNQEQQIQTATTMFGSSAASAMLTLIKAGPAAFDASAASIQNHATVMQGAAAQSQNLKTQIQILQSGLSDLLIKVGLKIVPQAQQILDAVLGKPGKGLAYDITLNVKEFVQSVTGGKGTGTGGFWGNVVKGVSQTFKDIVGMGSGTVASAFGFGKSGIDALQAINPVNLISPQGGFGNFAPAASAFRQGVSGYLAGNRSANDLIDLYGAGNSTTTGGRLATQKNQLYPYAFGGSPPPAPAPMGPFLPKHIDTSGSKVDTSGSTHHIDRVDHLQGGNIDIIGNAASHLGVLPRIYQELAKKDTVNIKVKVG